MLKTGLGKVFICLIILVALSTPTPASEVEDGSTLKVHFDPTDYDTFYIEESRAFDGLHDTPTVAVALGGGGARALVNIGVLKALEEEQIPIDLVVGTSMGAIVAVMYGSGMPVDQIEEMVTEVNLPQMFHLNFPFHRSLLYTTELNYFLEACAPIKDLEEFSIPTALLSLDLNRGVKYVQTKGPISIAVQGPYAIPIFFPGQQVGDFFLIDAGIQELTPSKTAKVLGADLVISTTAFDELPYSTYDSSLRSTVRLINIIKDSYSKPIVNDYSDVVIDHDVGAFSFMDFHLAKEFVELGYQETKKQIPMIQQLLAEKGIPLREPIEKHPIEMDEFLQDVQNERLILDCLIVEPLFYYGKDHSLWQGDLFRGVLMKPQYGAEIKYQRVSMTLLLRDHLKEGLEVQGWWKKLTPRLDFFGRMDLDLKGTTNWEMDLVHYGKGYSFVMGYGHQGEEDYLHLINTFDVKQDWLTWAGETDLRLSRGEGIISQWVSAHDLKMNLPKTKSFYINPKIVASNYDDGKSVPHLYRGVWDLEQPWLTGSGPGIELGVDLIYDQQFAYSVEILQSLQVTNIEYHQFVDYKQSAERGFAVGTGIAMDVKILGIKPSHLGGFLAYDLEKKMPRLTLDLDFTF